jgi:hypothetical protein
MRGESRSVRGKVSAVGENRGFEGDLILVRLVNKGRTEMRGRESSDVGFTPWWTGPGGELSVLRLKGEQITPKTRDRAQGRVHSSKALQCTLVLYNGRAITSNLYDRVEGETTPTEVRNNSL